MLSEINRICDASTYVPILTEIQGLGMIADGIKLLGISSALKIDEYYMSRKHRIPLITEDAARLSGEVGVVVLKEGFKRIAPAGIMLAVYVLGSKLLLK